MLPSESRDENGTNGAAEPGEDARPDVHGGGSTRSMTTSRKVRNLLPLAVAVAALTFVATSASAALVCRRRVLAAEDRGYLQAWLDCHAHSGSGPRHRGDGPEQRQADRWAPSREDDYVEDRCA